MIAALGQHSPVLDQGLNTPSNCRMASGPSSSHMEMVRPVLSILTVSHRLSVGSVPGLLCSSVVIDEGFFSARAGEHR